MLNHRLHECVHVAARAVLHANISVWLSRRLCLSNQQGSGYRCGRIQLLPSHKLQHTAPLLVVPTEASGLCSRGTAVEVLTGNTWGEQAALLERVVVCSLASFRGE